jgi:GNAT superfamily N-acetyltransferase
MRTSDPGRETAGRVVVRRAVPADAAAIGAVFDAATRAGWAYLGELAAEPMFTRADWDRLVANHAPPKILVVAVQGAEGVVGYAAANPGEGELFLLFVHPAHAGRGIGRILLAAAHDELRRRLPRGLSLRPRAERASAGRLCGRRLPTRRLGTRVGLPRHAAT